MSKRYLLFMAGFVPLFLLAQQKAVVQYAHKHYDVYDGILGQSITYMFQDSKGFLWFRDSRFFYRFNGKTMQNIGLDNRDYQTTLFECKGKIYAKRASGQVFRIETDLHLGEVPAYWHRKTALLHTSWGQLFSEPLAVQFISLMKNPKVPLLSKLKLSGITYYFTPRFALHASSGQLKTDTLKNKYNFYSVSNDHIYLYGYDSISSAIRRIYLSRGKLQETDITAEKIRIPRINRLLADNEGRVLYCSVTDSAIYFIDQGKVISTGIKAVERSHLTPYTKYLQDREGDHWVGCGSGLYNLFDLQFQEFYIGDRNLRDYYQTLAEDTKGQIWYTSKKAGLCLLKTDGSYKEVKSSNKDNKKCIGMYFFDTKSFALYPEYIVIQEDNSIQKIKVNTKYLGSVEEDQINNRFAIDFNDGSRSGIYLLTKTGKNFWKLKTIYWGKSAITSMSHGDVGNFFVSGLKGEGYLIGDSLAEDNNPHPYERVYTSSYDKWGNLWKGTQTGLYLNRSPIVINKSFITNPFYRIMQESRVASRQLVSMVPSVLVFDDLLFACCENKLFVLDLNRFYLHGQDRFFEFNRTNGYDVEEEQMNGLFVDKSRYLWILAPEKIIRVPFSHIHTLINKTSSNTPFINQILASQNNLNWVDLTDSVDDLSLANSFKTLQFSYQVNSMKFPDNMVYRYKLEGNSDNWSDATANKTITYSNLKHGTYRFLVETGVDGVKWSTPVITKFITIRIAWWQRPLVWSAMFILLIAIIAFAILTIYQTQYRRLERKRKLAQIQLQAIKAKSIPHFTGNALTSITTLFLKNDISKATEYMKLFNQFVNQILNYADETERPLRDELEFARQYLSLEKLRFDNKLDFRFDISEDVDLSIMLPAMILHTWCENAVKHGLKEKKGIGKLLISARKERNNYLIFVEDNGIGREAALLYKSSGNQKGLLIVEQQVSLLNEQRKQKMEINVEDLIDSERNPAGTRFSLLIYF